MPHRHEAKYNQVRRELERAHDELSEAFRVENKHLSDEEFDIAWEPHQQAHIAAMMAAKSEYNRIDRELRAAGAIR